MRSRTVGPRICARLTAAFLLASCASPGVPPGGPEDLDPPALVRVRPDTGAVNVRADAIGFDFDDVVSERPQGATSLADLFLISPSRGRTALSWRRTRLEVRPREGFRPNTTYRVTLLPGLVDLDGNVDSVGHSLVFSTGPTIATGVITGRVFDWMAEKVAPQALVEAIVLPDSLRYLAVADSLGRFSIRNLPAGSYVLRGLVDQNKNRFADARELYDT
ncbi:MAG: Ig-like domain-containing protein, partial [Gemmatimonadetes bacterium]|nr:Ig-like domain-containing protein [Gemmatimonadota bacterium]